MANTTDIAGVNNIFGKGNSLSRYYGIRVSSGAYTPENTNKSIKLSMLTGQGIFHGCDQYKTPHDDINNLCYPACPAGYSGGSKNGVQYCSQNCISTYSASDAAATACTKSTTRPTRDADVHACSYYGRSADGSGNCGYTSQEANSCHWETNNWCSCCQCWTTGHDGANADRCGTHDQWNVTQSAADRKYCVYANETLINGKCVTNCAADNGNQPTNASNNTTCYYSYTRDVQVRTSSGSDTKYQQPGTYLPD